MKIKKVLITIFLATFIIISFNYSFAAPLTEPSTTDEAPTLYRIHPYLPEFLPSFQYQIS